MIFILLGPPTYGGRRPLRTGDDASDAAGMSTVGSHDASTALHAAAAASPSGKTSTGQAAQIQDRFSAPGSKILDSEHNWREIWHYRRELLPSGVSYHQVDFEFITKKGYGSNVLQRDPQVLNTIDAARRNTH